MLRARIDTFRELANLTHVVTIPDQFKAITKQFRSPYVRDVMYRTTAALTQYPPMAHVEPRDETQEAKRAASIAEQWTMAAIQKLNRDLDLNVLFEAPLALVRDGESVIKVVDRADAWANFPIRDIGERPEDYLKRTVDYAKGASLPFAWRVVDRKQMLFGNGEFGDDWALEYGEYGRPYLAARYGMTPTAVDGVQQLVDPRFLLGSIPKPEGFLRSSTGRSVKLEFWDAEWWAVVVDGHMAPDFPRPNPYAPRIPYFRARTDSQSYTVLYPLLHLVPLLDSLMTMKTNWAYLGAYPSPVVESTPNQMTPNIELPLGDDDQSSKLVWKPGKALQLPVGMSLRFLEPPPVGKDIDEMISMTREMIDLAGIPSVFRGVGGADQAGYAINQLIAAAQLTYRRLAEASQRQLEQACEFLWWLVRYRINETVYVQAAGKDGRKWLGLKPEGTTTATEAAIDKLGTLEFTFRPVLPTDEQARAMIAVQLVNSPQQMVSKRYALEHFLNVENPEDMADEIAVEKALESPPLSDMVTEHALRLAGITPPQPQGPPPGANGSAPPPNDQQGMIPPGPGELQAQAAPGALSGVPGVPSVPGITQPLGGPMPPSAPTIQPARSLGGVAGGYPGLPGNQGPQSI